MRGLTVAAAVVGLALWVAETHAEGARQSFFPQFVLSGGSLYCGTELFPHEGSGRWLACWRPRNGFVASMTHGGRPLVETRPGYRRWRPPTDGALRPGETWWVSRDRRVGRGKPPPAALFRCVARTDGLRCVNAGGRGWWLGRHRGFRIT